MARQFRNYTDEEIEKLHKLQLDMIKQLDEIFERHGIKYFAIAGTALGAIRHQGYIPWDDDIDIAMLREDYEKLLKVYKEEFGDKYTLFGPDSEIEDKYYNFVPIVALNGTRLIVPLSKDYYDTGIFIDIFIYENIPDEPKAAEKHINKTFFWRNLYVMGRANFELLKEGATAVQRVKYAISSVVRCFEKIFDKDGVKIRRKYLKKVNKYDGKTDTFTILGDPYSRKCTVTRDEIFPIKRVKFEDFQMPVMNQYEKVVERRFGKNFMEIPPVDKRVNHCPYILDFGDKA